MEGAFVMTNSGTTHAGFRIRAIVIIAFLGTSFLLLPASSQANSGDDVARPFANAGLLGQDDPGPASLTIDVHTCQPGHDPVDPIQTLVAVCDEPTDDILFSLERDGSVASASTGTGGRPATIRFGNLAAGAYLLTEAIPDTVSMAYIAECRSDVRTFAYPFFPFAIIEEGGRIQIELLPGENMVCAWHNVLAGESGSLTIEKFWCEGDVISEEVCDLYPGGILFTLVPQDGREEISLKTEPDGTVTVEVTGVFDVVEEGFEWCSAESDAANAEGFIVVESGHRATMQVFNCGPIPVDVG
jgi:hypothetical protein